MSYSILLYGHVVVGAIALISGAIALIVAKGQKRHKLSGTWFVYTMLAMALSGLFMASLAQVFITVLSGALTLYLVLSGWISIKRDLPTKKECELGLLFVGVLVLIFGTYLSMKAFSGITDNLGSFQVPPTVYYVFTAICAVAVLSDIRYLLAPKTTRSFLLVRHIWRMCFPLYIAASSFFMGQQRVFPESLQGTFYLTIPPLLVIFCMIFWMLRVKLNKFKIKPGV
ncbi:DUF2306 domain-containing protein [Lacimicrobium sp. SS2-24]|uniref:DUF2306 domain-containing protein n=1 Tax=Lacimicrobium sp. SS2-24 TaxID=2005569 RepID=UPI000B4B2E30|nr:DUF2306 domain-containing protein [Lacimicrobium sp. SS2-24]